MDEKIAQEFYCTMSGGGCGGYFVCKLNINITGIVEMICPKCKHKHQRMIKNGQIMENGRNSGSPAQEIEPPLSAWSEKPKTVKMEKYKDCEPRDSAIIDHSKALLNERLFELYGAKI